MMRHEHQAGKNAENWIPTKRSRIDFSVLFHKRWLGLERNDPVRLETFRAEMPKGTISE
jgi:hypothetical protein